MFELTAANIATILIDGSAVFLLVGVYIETYIMRKRNQEDDRLFFLMLLLDTIMALSDIPAYLIDRRDIPGGRIINIGSMTVFYIAMALFSMVFFHYCIVRFKAKDSNSSQRKHAMLFYPGLFLLALIVLNIVTGFIFYVDENNYYHHGVLFVPMFVIMFVYIIAGFVMIARYRSGSENKVLIPIWIFILPVALSLIVPFALGGISLTGIGVGMSVVFTHLGSASELAQTGMEGGEAA